MGKHDLRITINENTQVSMKEDNYPSVPLS
jgi:hypothetical protein